MEEELAIHLRVVWELVAAQRTMMHLAAQQGSAATKDELVFGEGN